MCVECLIGKQKKPILFKVTEPSSVPYRAPPACAKRAAYPDPPPVIPLPESIAAQAAYQLRYKNTGQLRPEMFPGIGALPKPATESHVVNRGTPVAPCLWPLSAKGPEKKSHPRGKPLQSSFPKYHELFKEPHHCKAAGNSLRLTAKSASMFRVLGVCFKRSPVSGRVVNNPRHEHSLLNLRARTLPTQCACFLCRLPTVRLQRHFAKNFETSAP